MLKAVITPYTSVTPFQMADISSLGNSVGAISQPYGSQKIQSENEPLLVASESVTFLSAYLTFAILGWIDMSL